MNYVLVIHAIKDYAAWKNILISCFNRQKNDV